MSTNELTDVALSVGRALRPLDWRQKKILTERLLAEQPATLQKLGDDLGLTRERIRQLERDARSHLLEQLSDDRHGRRFLHRVTSLANPVASVATCESLVEGFADRPAGLGVTVGEILTRLHGAATISGGWLASPDVPTAQANTVARLRDLADTYGVVPLERAAALLPSLRGEELEQWLTQCGVMVMPDHVIVRTTTQGDRAVAILSITGRPMTPTELMAFGVGGSAGSVKNYLRQDARVVRSDKTHYALAEWGTETYTSVVDLIAEAIEAAGGSISLDTLKADLASRYSISPASVITYARSDYRFRVDSGVVSRSDNPHEALPRGTRSKRMYRTADAWLLRVEVTHDHLRGSGFVIPGTMAQAAGLIPGQKVHRPSPDGPRAVSWSRMQPTVGSIRPAMLRLGCEIGDQVFLVFADDGSFDVRPVTGSGVHALIGGSPEVPVWRAVAAALDTDEEDPVELLRRLVLDGDTDVVRALPTEGMSIALSSEFLARRANDLLLEGWTLSEVGRALDLGHSWLRHRFSHQYRGRRRVDRRVATAAA